MLVELSLEETKMNVLVVLTRRHARASATKRPARDQTHGLERRRTQTPLWRSTSVSLNLHVELSSEHVTALGGATALVSKGIYSFPTRFPSLPGCYAPVQPCYAIPARCGAHTCHLHTDWTHATQRNKGMKKNASSPSMQRRHPLR